MKFYETDKFKRRQVLWYKKLKLIKFKDIETLKDIRTNHINKQIIQVNFNQIRHFALCSEYFNMGLIKDKFDYFIFDNYRDGISAKEIKKLTDINFKLRKLSEDTIERRILKILKSAGIEPITFNF